MDTLEFYLLANSLESVQELQSKNDSNALPNEVLELTLLLLKGNYLDILKNTNVEKVLNDIVLESKTSIQSSYEFFAGIACLHLYIQANWTGPTVKFETYEPQWLSHLHSNKSTVTNALQSDGEVPFSKAQFPELLYISQLILVQRQNSSHTTWPWWSLRAGLVHQSTLSGRSNTVKQKMIDQFDKIYKSIQQAQVSDAIKEELLARYYTEIGLMWNYYKSTRKSKDCFENAKGVTGLVATLTGKLGVRTKFQTFQTAQLVLEADSKREATHSDSSAPRTVDDDDEILLPKPTLLDQQAVSKLHIIDQVILLCFCLDVKNNNPKHGLTNEEMMAYVQRVAEHPSNWLVFSTCLLLKSRLEAEKQRTAEKGVLQIQALVDQYDDTDSTVAERMKFFFSLPYPTRWDLKKELAERFLSLGAAVSALQIFEEMEMWEDMIDCYRVMEKLKKAEDTVKERLKIEPSPLLYCLLGDLTDDVEAYKTAWEFSNHRFARAQRSLAKVAVTKSDWKAAIEHYELALAINPLYHNCWFTLGCAYMRLEEWEKALNAFARVTQQEPETGEAWNNMASIYVQLKKKKEAFYALQEGLKYLRANWMMWQNFLYICMDIGEFQQAINAVKELLDIKEKDVDTEILSMLCQVVTKNMVDANGQAGSTLKGAIDNLMQTVAGRVSTPEFFSVYAKYYMDLGDKEKMLEYREKQNRAAQKAGWESDAKLFEAYARSTLDLAEAYIQEGSSKSIWNAKTKVRGAVKKSEESFANHALYKELEQTLDKLQSMEQ